MLDWDKPLQTKSRCPAVLMGRLPHPNDGMPMVVRVHHCGAWVVETFATDGSYLDDRPSPWDLMNAEVLEPVS